MKRRLSQGACLRPFSASVSIWFYADQAFFMPEIAPGISVMPLVRRTIDYWLDQRMRRDADAQGIDWTTWEGKPSGYEGYLADSFRFLQAVLLREPSFRAKFYRPLRDHGPAEAP
jgi:hypothetical protein